MPKFLHAYSGATSRQRTTRLFSQPEWEEVKMDPDNGSKPDIVGTLVRVGGLDDASFDAVFTARSLEHLYPHEVDAALKNCLRILRPEGYMVIVGVDIEEACLRASQGKLLEKIYDSPAGPVTPLDILYGFRPALAAGKLGYASHTGFTTQSLGVTLARAGFLSVWTSRSPETFTLFAIASKNKRDGGPMRELAKEHFSAA